MIECPTRLRIDLNLGWEFVRRRVNRRWLAGRGDGGTTISLPHCWNARDTFQYGQRSYSGWGGYRRTVSLPKTPTDGGIFWRLRTGGFYGVGDVWLNNRRLASVDGQYVGVAIDLPPTPTETEQTLAIRLDNRWHRDVLPGFRQPDFILHGGLAGGMWLEGLPEIHFDADRIEVNTDKDEDGNERLSIRWNVCNRSTQARQVSSAWSIIASDGTVVGRAQSQQATLEGGTDFTTHEVGIHMPNAQHWSPDNPVLYWAEGNLQVDGSVIDVVKLRFGITHGEFRHRQGFFLDGHRVALHGCNRHEAIPGFGNALPKELQRRDADILKEIGCNFVRLSHYPQSPAFLDACDEVGIMVYAEIATWKSVRSARGWRRAARRQMRDLIVRDRHHPSVILWGMGNESRSRKTYLELRSIAHELDPSRSVIYAENHLYRAKRQHTVGIPDVWGVNYELGVLEEACSSSRVENVVVSECCNHPESVRGDDREELIQVATIERDWELMADRPYVAGHAVWSFTDYATEHRSRFRRLPGLFDAWRRPKMAAELFRARYAKRPFVSVFATQPGLESSRSRFRYELRRDDQATAVAELHVFTNCETIRLTRDGLMLAELEGALHYVVPLYGSFEEILATGSMDGTVAQDSLRRHGEAGRIHIRTTGATATPTVELDVEIHDKTGTVVRDWNGSIQLQVDGPGRTHTYNNKNEVMVARGVGRTYVTINGGHEAIVVTASCDGLSPGILSLHD